MDGKCEEDKISTKRTINIPIITNSSKTTVRHNRCERANLKKKYKQRGRT